MSDGHDRMVLASPLIGAAARGFPEEIVFEEVAASQTCLWLGTHEEELYDDDCSIAANIIETIAFGKPNPTTAEKIVNMITQQSEVDPFLS